MCESRGEGVGAFRRASSEKRGESHWCISPNEMGAKADALPEIRARDARGRCANMRASLVPVEGVEPPWACAHLILSQARLPFRHTGP